MSEVPVPAPESEAERAQAEDAAGEARARAMALRFLGRKARTVSEVRRFLEGRGVGDDLADRTVEWLSGLGYLDDRAYAQAAVESFSRIKPAGRRLIAWELERRGVDRELVREVLAPISADDELRLAILAARRRLARMPHLDPGRARRRLEAHLVRRGFEPETVAKALSEVEEKAAELEDSDL